MGGYSLSPVGMLCSTGARPRSVAPLIALLIYLRFLGIEVIFRVVCHLCPASGCAKLMILCRGIVQSSSPVLDHREANVYQALQCVASLITDVENAKLLARQQIAQLLDELDSAKRERDQALSVLQETQKRLKLIVSEYA